MQESSHGSGWHGALDPRGSAENEGWIRQRMNVGEPGGNVMFWRGSIQKILRHHCVEYESILNLNLFSVHDTPGFLHMTRSERDPREWGAIDEAYGVYEPDVCGRSAAVLQESIPLCRNGLEVHPGCAIYLVTLTEHSLDYFWAFHLLGISIQSQAFSFTWQQIHQTNYSPPTLKFIQ